MINEDIIVGMIVQRIIEAKHNGGHYLNHGISYPFSPIKIKNKVKRYCPIISYKIEQLPYGYNLTLIF